MLSLMVLLSEEQVLQVCIIPGGTKGMSHAKMMEQAVQLTFVP